MTLTDPATFDAGRVFLRMRASTKAAVLAELATRAGLSLGLDQAQVLAALRAREELGSTGVGAGIAVPHARLEGLSTIAGFFARLERPVAFDAIDGKPVDLVVMLLSPPTGHGQHLAALAQVSRLLRNPVTAEALRGTDDAGVACGLLTSSA
jgi:PTS system nitrogen regulatory IIA component